MPKKILCSAFIFLLISTLQVKSKDTEQGSTYKRCFIGSSLFMLGNFENINNSEYIQLNFVYRITSKNVISSDFHRSIYSWPLGILFSSPSFHKNEYGLAGHVRIIARKVSYQCFLWKRLFASVHALNAFEKYKDENGKKNGNDYTLNLNFHLGYQLKFIKNRFFFEPAIGCSYWLISTNFPDYLKKFRAIGITSLCSPG